MLVHVNFFGILTLTLETEFEQALLAFRVLLKNTRIIWSDILPRLRYEGELEGAGKCNTINLNKWAHFGAKG